MAATNINCTPQHSILKNSFSYDLINIFKLANILPTMLRELNFADNDSHICQ